MTKYMDSDKHWQLTETQLYIDVDNLGLLARLLPRLLAWATLQAAVQAAVQAADQAAGQTVQSV